MIDIPSFIEANSRPAIATDSTGKILSLNKISEIILDLEPDKWVGKNITEILPGVREFFIPGNIPKDQLQVIQEYTGRDDRTRNIEIQGNVLNLDQKKYFWFLLNDKKKVDSPVEGSEFYKRIVNLTPRIIGYFDPGLRCTFINPTVKGLLGYEPVEIHGKILLDFIHPDDHKKFMDEYKLAIQKREIASRHSIRLTGKDGKIVRIKGLLHHEYDLDAHYQGAVFDLEEDQPEDSTREKLALEEKKFQLLTESILDVVTWLDAQGNVLYQSPSFSEILGYDPAIYRHITDFDSLIHPDDLRYFKITQQKKTKIKENDYRIQYRIRNRTGRFRWFESFIRNLFDDQGTLRNIILTSRDITEHHLALDKLQESQTMYHYLAENSSDVIIRLDSNDQLTYISPSSIQLFGYKPEDILFKGNFFNFIFADDRPVYERRWKEDLDQKNNFQVERLRLNHKDGFQVWVEIIAKREFDREGRIVQSIVNLRDISDRIRNQLEVEKIKERYQLAVEAGHTGVWDYSFENNQLIVDESLKNLLGYQGNEEIDEVFFWEKLVAEEDRKELKRAIDANIRLGKSYFEETFRMVHRHRVLLWVLGRGKIFYQNDVPYRIVCSVTDITDRKEASEQLRKTLINFKAIFDAFPDLFFRVDRIGDFLEIMAGESSDFGITNITSFEGRNLQEAFPESEYLKLYDCLQKTFESREVEKCEYRLKVNGRKKYYEARMIAITDEEAIGIVRDITESVKINKELFNAKRTAEEALNAKDEFLSMMSHEIRTPLNVVIGMIYLLLEQDPRDDQLKFINTLKFSADNLLSLINDLLDFSKIKAGKIVFERSDFNLREVIHNVYYSYQLQLDSSKVNVSLDIDDNLPNLVYGDSKRLSQILNNLLSNAQKFTERGIISISVKLNKTPDHSNLIEFRISDTGIGISKKKIKTIFEPFEQGEMDISRKYGGTGLGLTIVKQLVELQNGSIQVNSKTGEGSTFIISIPFDRHETRSEKEESHNHATSLIQSMESLNILYADDVNSNLFLMKGYADLWKFHLDTANNGKDTLALFNENTYDVILLDLQMPVMNGFDIAREIREIEKSIGVYTPILAVTGDLSDETRTKIFEAGMDDYLSKPVNPKMMIEKIGILHNLDRRNGSLAETKDEEEPYDDKNAQILEFQQLDYLYEEVPDQYIQYINMLIREFQTNLQLIKTAFLEENYDEFRRIRHSMKSNMKLLKMHSLQNLMDEIKDKFALNQLPTGGGTYFDQVEAMITGILEKLDSKLKVLSN
jgi:PAS domain S-box-containing protein